MDKTSKKAVRMNQLARNKPSPKKVRGFLGLPAEIRNQIYDYYFEDDYRVEIAAKGVVFQQPKPKTVKLCLPIRDKDGNMPKYKPAVEEVGPQTLRMSRTLGRYQRVDGIRTNWTKSLCPLILVCKQVHSETLPFLYQNTTFVFQAPRQINDFINSVPTKNLSWITKLHLHYTSYGAPPLRETEIFRTKHLRSWNKACRLLSKRLVNLEELEIWANVHHNFGTLSLRGECLQPLLQFRELSLNRHSNTKPQTALSRNSNDNAQVLKRVAVHYITHSLSLHRGGVVFSKLITSFRHAIERAILGWTEKDAMAELNAVWDGHDEMFQEYLRAFCGIFVETDQHVEHQNQDGSGTV